MQKKKVREWFPDVFHILVKVRGEWLVRRTAFASVAVLMIFASVLVADDKKAPGNNTVHAVFVKADTARNTVTFKTTEKAGKTVEMTLALAKDAKVLGQDNKPETFASFANNMQKQKGKSILVVEDKAGKQILEIRDMPN
jgi:hypothetical protein